ncbi:hypothetical protein SDC9_160550 [bioreactor metagenome]|uniref:Uncharacterized protein n=1 Tax=bioreactor metagenome TaxID=1076179 RepID=A0A645FIQ2_9ZZZZ
MRACVVKDHQVADLYLRQMTVDGKFIIVLAQGARYIVYGGEGRFPFARDGDVVIGAIHGRAHQVDSGGIQANVSLVRVFFVHGAGDEPAVGAGHIAAQLGLDGNSRGICIPKAPVKVFLHAFTDQIDIRRLFIRPVGDADAARQVDKIKRKAAFLCQLLAGLIQ